MKKAVLKTFVFVLLVASVFAQSGLKEKVPVMNTRAFELIDYKGKSLGSEIPE